VSTHDDDVRRPIRQKLIEVSIPLEDINAESALEKFICHGQTQDADDLGVTNSSVKDL
jgi:hypothetical protein